MGVDGTGFTSHGNHIDEEEQDLKYTTLFITRELVYI
jgi:hypothetical protein